MKRLGKNLWRLRRREGFSQDDLALMCGLHRTEISLIERGKRIPRADTLLKLAGSLGVRVEQLLDGIEWIPPGAADEGRLVALPEGPVS
jgi:transcriptional regulator with XRE-family HTH domain